MFRTTALTILFLATTMTAPAFADPPALVELQLGGDKLQGKIVARNGDALWLVGQNGRMTMVKSIDADKIRQISPRFSGWTVSVSVRQFAA